MWSEHFQDVDTDALRGAVIPPQEEFMKGWLVVFINEYRQEQERVLLLSKEALYRVKFNFSNQKILRFQRTSISDIVLIERGVIGDLDSKYYGFKLYYKDKSHMFGNSNTSDQPFFTFRPVVDEAHYSSIDAQKTLVESIMQNIVKAKRISLQVEQSKSEPPVENNLSESLSHDHLLSQEQLDQYLENFTIEVDNLKIAGALPVLSLAHNALGLGIQRPKKKQATIQKPKPDSQPNEQPSQVPEIPSEPLPEPLPQTTEQLPSEIVEPTTESSLSESTENVSDNNIPSNPPEPTQAVEPDQIVTEPVQPVPQESNKKIDYVEVLLGYLHKVNTRTLAQLLEQIDSESHYIYGVLVAFFLGYGDFSILWIIAVLYIIQTYTSSKWSKLHSKHKQSNLHHVNVVLNAPVKSHRRGFSDSIDKAPVASSSIVDPLSANNSSATLPATSTLLDVAKQPSTEHVSTKTLPPIALLGSTSNITYPFNIVSMIETSIEPESCEWFNTMISQLWKYMVKHLSDTAKETSLNLLQNTLFKNLPDSEGFTLTALEITEFYLGDSSPTIKNMIASKPEFPDFRIEFDMHFNAGPSGKVLADLVVTRGTAMTLKVPLSVDSFAIEGKMRVEFVFFSRYPYIHSMRYTFLEPPQFNMAIKPLCTFNIMAFPFLKDYLASHLQQLLETSIVFPYQLSLLYFNLFSLPTEATYDDTSLMTPEDMNKHIPLVEKAERDGDFAGLLHVRVVEARKLNTEAMGVNSCPYCIVSIGAQVFTTRVYKTTKSKTALWNEFFELLVTKGSHKKVEITVMARDIMAGDDFVGTTSLEFGHAGTEPKDVWVSIKRSTELKKKEKQAAGEIRLQYRFIPNLATTAATISSSTSHKDTSLFAVDEMPVF